VEKLSPLEVAEKLAELHGKTFGGKSRGRYLISHDQLRDLSGRQVLKESIIGPIGTHLLNEHKLALIDLGYAYGVIDANKVLAWRRVPKKWDGKA
jgi:hypothetical protein